MHSRPARGRRRPRGASSSKAWGKAGHTILGVVRGIVPFGVFVELGDGEVTGLLPNTDISHERVSDAAHVFNCGDVIKVGAC